MCKKIILVFLFVTLSGCVSKYVPDYSKPSVKVTITSSRDMKIGLFTHGSTVYISDEDCKNTRILGTIRKKAPLTFDIEADKTHIITFRTIQHNGGWATLATELSTVLGTEYEVNFFSPASMVLYEKKGDGERRINESITKPKKFCKIR